MKTRVTKDSDMKRIYEEVFNMRGIGSIAFIVGLILAAIIAVFGAATTPTWALWIMAILGVVIGLLNVTYKEVQLFLIAGLTFLISFQALSAVFTTLTYGWPGVATFFSLMSVFVSPAVAIVALVALFKMMRS